MRLLKSLTVLAVILALALPAAAQDRAKAEEVIVAFAAEPRTLLPNTIVDWTTNNMPRAAPIGPKQSQRIQAEGQRTLWRISV